jgi:inhibitor of cysteine peptidase
MICAELGFFKEEASMRRWGYVLRCLVVLVFLTVASGIVNAQPVATERYSGMMPCADCSGIRTTLVLNRSGQGEPTNFTMLETYVGRPAAGNRTTSGTWAIVHGDSTDKNATVYQLHSAGSTAVTSFLKVDNELRMLGGDMTELPASVPHTLKLFAADKVVFKVNDQTGGAVSVKLGGELEVQLPANHTTGYSWILAPVAEPVLTSQGKAAYAESRGEGKVGAGGVETWQFKAVKAGTEGLQFEYRRPWEKSVPAAKTVTIRVTVP